MKKLLAILLSVGILIGTVSLTAFTANLTPEITIEEFTEQLSEMNKEYKDEPVSNRLIVKSKHDIPILDGVDIVEGYQGLHIVQFDNGESARKALEYYNNNKLIEYAEEGFPVGVANDGIGYGEHLSWGSEAIGVDDYIDYLGDVETLPEVVVGIIDTGIDLDHEFLEDRILETNFNISESGEPNSEDDDNGHGSHVAGIVVDNTTENVMIKGYKVMSSGGSGSSIDIVTAIYAATDDGVDVINMSLGGAGKDIATEEAVKYAVQKGIAVCVSAGNSASDAKYFTPANIEECITVAAHDEDYTKPFFSNWGDMVDIVAPGVAIDSSYKDNSYRSLSGTSMACPFVSAASALLKSKDKQLNSDEICGFLQENGKTWVPESRKDYIDSLYGKKALYIGNITSEHIAHPIPRTEKPEFNFSSGNYENPFYLEITAPEPTANIYYTLDGSRATLNNGIRYTEPILIDKTTSVHAIAYVEGKLKSLQKTARYYMVSEDEESNFEIDENGIITKYTGSNNYLKIPDTINGIPVKGIGDKVFRRKNIVMIKCPDTLTYVGKQAFYFAQHLYSFYCSNLQTAEQEAFYRCDELLQIDLTNLTSVGKAAFYHCVSIPAIYNDKLTEVSQQAFGFWTGAVNIELPNVTKVNVSSFAGSFYIESIKLPNLETAAISSFAGCHNLREADYPKLKNIEQPSNMTGGIFSECSMLSVACFPNLEGSLKSCAFQYCSSLKTVYLPKVTQIYTYCFRDTSVETLFIPQATIINSLPNTNTTIYSNGNFTSSVSRSDFDYDYHIIAPDNSDAETWAHENGYSFTDSDTMVDTIGTHTDENGNTVFEFGWRNIDELEQYASEIEYYGENADNPSVTYGDSSLYTREPSTCFGVPSSENKLRGCVNIDGMKFRSRALSIGENELEPENGCEHNWQIIYTVSVPNDTIVVLRCDKCDSYYRISFMDHINTDYPLLDMNNDNIVNAKDLAYIISDYQRS